MIIYDNWKLFFYLFLVIYCNTRGCSLYCYCICNFMCTFTVCTLFCSLNIKLFSYFQMNVRHSEFIRDGTLRDGRHAVPRPLCIIDCQVHRAAARLCEANPCICRHIAFKATDKLPFRLGDVCRHKGPNTGPYRNTKPPPPSLSALQGTEEHLCDCWGDLAPEAEESAF